MSIESTLFGALQGLVSGRCYMDAFPQPTSGAMPVPAIRVSLLGGTIDLDICGAGTEATDSITVQVDIVAAKNTQRETLRQQVRAAMAALSPAWILRAPPIQDYDGETNLYRSILEFTVYGSG